MSQVGCLLLLEVPLCLLLENSQHVDGIGCGLEIDLGLLGKRIRYQPERNLGAHRELLEQTWKRRRWKLVVRSLGGFTLLGFGGLFFGFFFGLCGDLLFESLLFGLGLLLPILINDDFWRFVFFFFGHFYLGSVSVGFYLFSIAVVVKISLIDQACPYEIPEERMGLDRTRLEFGMELAGDKPGVVGKLKDFNQVAIR